MAEPGKFGDVMRIDFGRNVIRDISYAIKALLRVGAVCCAALLSYAQSGAANGEWPTYGGDLGSTRYSPLDQINAGNFSKLEVAWRFKTDNLGPRPEFKFKGRR